MVERINLLLKAKNITARQFAEEIGIQPSGMSHIMSGRNNPSLDFVMKVIKRAVECAGAWGATSLVGCVNEGGGAVRPVCPTGISCDTGASRRGACCSGADPTV